MCEKEVLNKIAANSGYGQGLNKICTQYCSQIFMKHIVPGNILELGPAVGVMTDILFPLYNEDYTVVDGSELFVTQLTSRHIGIKGVASLIEDFTPPDGTKYSNIILGHVLEHVLNPVDVLKMCRIWLSDNGIILAAVPNANSIHRQAAVHMGYLKNLDDMSEKDYFYGHRRVFFNNTLTECFTNAGLTIYKQGGYWLKPLSDAQIEKDWTMEMIDAFLLLGEKYPDIAGEIYIIAKK